MDDQVGVYQDMLTHQTRLRDQAERRRREIRSAFVTIASIVAPDWLHEQLQSGFEPEQITDSVLIDQVTLRVKALALFEQGATAENDYRAQRDQARQANKALEQRLAGMRAELQQAQKAIEQQKAELRVRETELRAKEQELGKLRKQVLPVSKPMVNDEQDAKTLPNNPEMALQIWRRDRAHDRQAFILKILAETSGGLVFQQDIIRHCQQYTDWGVSDPVIAGLIRDLVAYTLIVVRQDGMTTVSGGRPRNKVELTDLGRELYCLLTGQQATGVDIEKLDRAHVTPQHRDLILWATHLLEENGYGVDSLTPSPIVLSGGRQCKPDILAFDGEDRVLVEVETDAAKSERDSKWLNLWEASGGEIFVICESKAGQQKVIAEVNDALGERPANFYFSNREEIEQGVRHGTYGIWLKVRLRKQ